MRNLILTFILALASTLSVGQVLQAPTGGVRTPSIQGQATVTTDASCGANQYWLRPVAGSLNAWRQCTNGTIQTSGSLTGLEVVSSTIQTAVTAACGFTPTHAVLIPASYAGLDSWSNTCGTVILDQRSMLNNGSGTLNVKNFGADGTGNGYVDMVTNSASHNVAGCYNMTSAQVVGKYLHVLRAGPAGGIFKSLITGFSGTTCTVADLPTASVTAGGWVSSNDDDAPAIQAAVDAAGVYGGEVVIPPGNYFILSPIKLPTYQTSTAPWTYQSIRIRGLGGNYSARIYYVQNATTGPLRAVIEGPTVRTATTSWSQTGTSLTINMVSNPYNVGDLLDFWSPTAGANNSGSTANTVGAGVTGGYYVQSKTATSVTVISDLNQTTSATEVGELSQMGKPVTPFISGIDFETLDYPYGGKTGTFLANGIDTHAYTSFDISNNFLGNLGEGIRIYRSWLGTISNNECYGANICIHAPKNLGALNAVRFIDNNLDAYGIYGILTEANQDGGSYSNSYIRNEIEGTSVNTRADIRINGGGNIFVAGYGETAGSHEATYYNLINDGYGTFTFHFPQAIWATSNTGSTYIFENTAGGGQYYPPAPAPTLTRVGGAGTFPAGRDVYIHNSLKNSTIGYETNPTVSNAYVVTNTVLNDQIQVNQTIYQDYSGGIDQFCVYEFDQATGGAAPTDMRGFRLVSCGPLGVAINVNNSQTTGTQQRSIGWSIAAGNSNTFIGIPPSLVSSSGFNAYNNNFVGGPNNSFLGGSTFDVGSGGLQFHPNVLNSTDSWPGTSTSPGRVSFAGLNFASSLGNGSDSAAGPGTGAFSTGAWIPGHTIVHNVQLQYVPTSPGDNNLFWVCANGYDATNGPVACSFPFVPSQWKRWGELFSRATNEGTAPPAAQTWHAGDYFKNLSPIAATETLPAIKGWLNIASGTPGTWTPDYVWNPFSPGDIGGTTPAIGSFTQGNFKSIGTDPATLCSQIGCSVTTWVKADALIGFSDGNPITTITDFGSTPHNYTCGTTKPTYKTNIFNGQPIIRFAPVANSACVTSAFTSTGSYSAFVVMSKPIGYTTASVVLKGGSFNYLQVPHGTATSVIWYNNQGSGGYPAFGGTMPADDGLQHIFSGTFQIGTSGTSGLWEDGTALATSTSATSVLPYVTSQTSVLSDNGAAAMSADVAEVIVISPALQTFNRQQIEAYLGAKWGINATLQNVVNIKDGSNTIIGGFDQAGKLISKGSQRGFTTTTYSATPIFDASVTDATKITLTGDVTSSQLLHITLGQTFSFEICQDGTGGHTFVWPSNVVGAATIGSAPNQCYLQTFIYDGTNALALTAMVSNAGKAYSNGSTGGLATLTFSATPTFDYTTTNTVQMTLTANVTSSTLAGMSMGQQFQLRLCQDGTGGWTFVPPANMKGAGTISPLANVCSSQIFSYDGTNAIAAGPMVTSNGSVLANGSIDGLSPITFSATPTLDFTTANAIKMTLTGNVTSSTLAGVRTGQPLTFIICQDGTGSWTFAWPANVKGAMTISAGINTCSAQSFIYDGTNAYAVSPGVTGQ